jgi:hypothetical protein
VDYSYEQRREVEQGLYCVQTEFDSNAARAALGLNFDVNI